VPARSVIGDASSSAERRPIGVADEWPMATGDLVVDKGRPLDTDLGGDRATAAP
jgi:hypothetical protein